MKRVLMVGKMGNWKRDAWQVGDYNPLPERTSLQPKPKVPRRSDKENAFTIGVVIILALLLCLVYWLQWLGLIK